MSGVAAGLAAAVPGVVAAEPRGPAAAATVIERPRYGRAARPIFAYKTNEPGFDPGSLSAAKADGQRFGAVPPVEGAGAGVVPGVAVVGGAVAVGGVALGAVVCWAVVVVGPLPAMLLRFP